MLFYIVILLIFISFYLIYLVRLVVLQFVRIVMGVLEMLYKMLSRCEDSDRNIVIYVYILCVFYIFGENLQNYNGQYRVF